MDTNCKSLTKTGEPCGATLYRDGWCYWHHPDLEAERQANRMAGGKARGNMSRARKRVLNAAMTLDELDGALCIALEDVLAGRLEPNVGTAAATIAGRIAGIRQASDLEARLASLEARAGLRSRSWSG